MLKFLMSVPGKDVNIERCMGLAPLHIAVNSCCLDAVTILVEAEAEVTVRDDKRGRLDMYSRCADHEIFKYLFPCKDEWMHLIFGTYRQSIFVCIACLSHSCSFLVHNKVSCLYILSFYYICLLPR